MISAIVLVKNEEGNIKNCIASLSFIDEIIVVDDNSTDSTKEVAQKLGAKVYPHSLNDDFSAQRNFGLGKIKNEWVLFVDADERVSENLALEILNITNKQNDYSAYYIRRRDFIWGQEIKHGETGNIKLLRLSRKDNGKWEGRIHEVLKVNGKIGELKNPLFHYPHQSLNEFLKEINFYTDLRTKELYEAGKHVFCASIILYPVGKFLINYFIKLGFLDGIPGLLLAILMSFHSFLVRGKLWLLWNKKRST